MWYVKSIKEKGEKIGYLRELDPCRYMITVRPNTNFIVETKKSNIDLDNMNILAKVINKNKDEFLLTLKLYTLKDKYFCNWYKNNIVSIVRKEL